MFDLKNDLSEQNDLFEIKPEITNKLRKMLHDWRRDMDAKMPKVKTPESRRQSNAQPATGNNLPVDVARFAPEWKVRDWGGPAMKPGLRATWAGRNNVLLTHPRSQTEPCVLSRKIDVPAGKRTTLNVEVTNHPKGDWKLVVLINGKQTLAKDIVATKWQPIQIDLTEHAGQSVLLELQNRATGWAYEAAYWSRLQLVH